MLLDIGRLLSIVLEGGTDLLSANFEEFADQAEGAAGVLLLLWGMGLDPHRASLWRPERCDSRRWGTCRGSRDGLERYD